MRKTRLYPSTANNRNQMKFSSGWTKGGPFSIEGCFCVYVVKTTDALVLFFKQRNLWKETEQGKLKTKGREAVSHAERKRETKSTTISTLCTEAISGLNWWQKQTGRDLWQWFDYQPRKGKITTRIHCGISRLGGRTDNKY